jgi:predicted acylesterase/phospholipase RssA
MNKTKKTALVLQGGGALGAYQYGAIKAFEEAGGFNPCIVTGVSIGAVNAAVYLGGKQGGVKSLETLWDTLKMPVVPWIPQSWQAKASKLGNPNMYYISPQYMMSPLTAESVYDVTPFRELLLDLIDFDKINKHEAALAIQAVNIETGSLETFRNHEGKGINVEHVIASMSIPPNFPMIKSDGGYYWDGGLYVNMPLGPAINYLETLPGDLERDLVVINLFRKGGKLPQNMMEISDRIKEIMFESKINLDNKLFDKINTYVDMARQLDVQLPADSPLRQHPGFTSLMQHKPINRLSVLQYTDEGVEGTDDFTPEAMEARVRAGYRDAQQALHTSIAHQ